MYDIFYMFRMNQSDEDRLRMLVSMVDKDTHGMIAVPWIQVASMLNCKTTELSVSTNDRINPDEREDFARTIRELCVEENKVYSILMMEFYEKDGVILAYTGIGADWIFKKQ